MGRGRVPLPRPAVTCHDGLVRIPLTGGFATLINEADWPLVDPYTWRTLRQGTRYPCAKTWVREGAIRRAIFMHRLILNAPPDLQVDHKNHDTLDNRRSNLRLVTPGQNQANQRALGGTSRFRGVRWFKNRWQAAVMLRGHVHYLGRFVDEEEAARAVDRTLRAVWSEHARLNFPDVGD